jgi:hypothetical protein
MKCIAGKRCRGSDLEIVGKLSLFGIQGVRAD